ncbi:MAG: flavodoxin family protein [Syntrophobacteraceae bacterium]
MKILVTYASWTGNTRKVAEAIFREMEPEKDLRELSEVTDLDSYDLIFVGFPMHEEGQPAAEARDFLKRRCAGRKVALFITHAAIEEFPLLNQWLENCKKAAEDTFLVAVFNCQGQMAQDALDAMLNSPDPKMRDFGGRVMHSRGQPDAVRLERARAFAKKVVADLSS